MSKKILFVGLVLLILLVIAGCTKNKFKITRSQPTDIPYYNPVNDSCFICHNVSTLKKTITTSLGEETVPLYVNRDKFARSLHRSQNCQDCHTDIVLHKGHPDVPKTYGGWANFSAEVSVDSTDALPTRNYTTQASIACANCHTDHADFLSSQHYLIGKIKSSHAEQFGGIQIGKDYDKAKCGKCHLTCATCHFKGEMTQKRSGEITTLWSQLLTGDQDTAVANELTEWAIDWTTNVEAHDFRTGEELESSNDMCRVCHTGYYTKYNMTGYYHPDNLQDFDSLVSQGVEKYPQYEERRLVKGDIGVNTRFPALDSLYDEVRNRGVMRTYKCIYCHDQIHSLTPISCNKCHSVSFNDFGYYPYIPHLDVACVACHDATMNVWRDPDSGDTVKVAAVKDNKVLNWHSHMLIKPDGVNTNFCDRRCHNPVVGPTIGAPWTYHHTGDIH